MDERLPIDNPKSAHGDHLGSTALTTDSSGHPVSEVRYLPYGEERWTNEVASPADFGFTSQREEKGFGLYDYNARYYSPALGRFISPDSIVPEPGSSSGFNRYRYARNNPLKYTDPSGHFECDDAQGRCLPNSAIPIRIPDVPDDYILSHFNEQEIPTDINFNDPSNAVVRVIIEDQIIYNAYQDGLLSEEALASLGQRSMGQRMGAVSEGEAVAMMFAGIVGGMVGGKMMGGGGTTCRNCGTDRPDLARSSGSLRIDPDGASVYCANCLKNGQTNASPGKYWIKSFDDYEAEARATGVGTPYYSPEPPGGPGHFSVFQGGPTNKSSDLWQQLNQFIRVTDITHKLK